jgi:hypothetical protein
MKFNILKLIFSIVIISLFITLTYGTQTQTQTQSTTTLQTEAKTIAGFKANYKMSLGSLIKKPNNKKKQNNSDALAKNNNNKNSELGKLSKLAPEQTAGNHVIFKEWIKYFKFTDSNKSKKPNHFFENVLYEKEARKKNANDKDKKNENVYFSLN